MAAAPGAPPVAATNAAVPPCAGGQAPGPDGHCSTLPLDPSAPPGANTKTNGTSAPVAPVDEPERLSRGTDSAADRELTLGDRAYHEDDLKTARQHYTEAKRLAARDPAPRAGLVRVGLLQANIATDYASGKGNPKVTRFLREIDEALKLEPDYAPALIERGRLLLILGRAESALSALKQGIALKARDPEAHTAMGVALLATGDAKNAVEHFEQAATLDPANAERLANLGTAYMMRGRVEDATTAYKKAVMLAPDDARAHGDLGTAFLAQHKLDQALPHLRRAVQLAPDRATFLSNLGYAYQLSGNLDEAVKTYRAALSKDPSLGSAWINLGTALAAQKKYTEAEAALKKALQLDPSDPRAKANLEELSAVMKSATP